MITTGTYNGSYYENGVNMITTGTYSSVYYLSGVATTLDLDGNGTWEGIDYLNGTPA